MRLFWIKIFKFEFWPWKVFYAPLLPYYLFLSAKCRSLTFPSLVNTCLQNGGFFEENKKEILTQIPAEYLPKSIYIEQDTDFTSVNSLMEQQSIEFPVVAKPLDEQRGKNVEIITDEAELLTYYLKVSKAFVVQEFVQFPIELAILYSRLPHERKGVVSSITIKEFLSVIGDGKQTIEKLLKANYRAILIWEELLVNAKIDFQRIPFLGETVIVEKIGNHCRGTIFRNASEIDKAKTAAAIDKVMADFEGFNYGRFDMKVKSVEDLYAAKNIKILELNGVNADAAHIFDPNYGFTQAMKDVAWHWKRMADIAAFNLSKGYSPIAFKPILNKILKS